MRINNSFKINGFNAKTSKLQSWIGINSVNFLPAIFTLMRAQAGLGKPLFLVSGNGFAFGRWCIVKITENQSNFLNDGAPRKIEFSISLKRYGEDQKRGVKGIIQNVVSSL